ncbi:MAG TPA: sigma-70 family RNA polymerase sigma factor [Thermoanaerobaculia bacterium]|nr:sigma-70 family RNA polymerase sigma factor [Thermoanaerobaculia bacterium]
MTAAQTEPCTAELSIVVEQTRPRLRALLKSHHIRPCDAEEILQEALLALVRKWPEVQSPEGYLIATVRRQILLFLRRRAADRCVFVDRADLEQMAGGHSPLVKVECRRDAGRLLARLPRRAAHILALRYGQGLSSHEIAALVEVAPSGVRTLARRHLARLRRLAASAPLRRRATEDAAPAAAARSRAAPGRPECGLAGNRASDPGRDSRAPG